MKISLIIFLFISGIFGILVSSTVIKNHKSNLLINIYFIIFIMILSLIQLTRGIDLLFFNNEIFTNFYFESSILIILLIVIHFYFKSLFDKKNKPKINEFLIHIIFPVFYYSISSLDENLQKKFDYFNIIEIMYYIFGIFVVTYNYLNFNFIYKKIWNRKKEKENQPKDKLIYKWTKFIYIKTLILSSYLIIAYWFYDFNKNIIFLPVSSIILIIICCKIVCYPEIFYGYNILKNKVNESLDTILKFDSIWIYPNKTSPSNLQDVVLKKKIDLKFTEYINQIENVILNKNILIESDIKIENLSNILKIPKSHLNYIFKYHSKITFIDLKKIIKIHYATNLIQNDYLKSNTLNCLSKKVGFASYDPFYRSFKKITGSTPLDYYNLIRANK